MANDPAFNGRFGGDVTNATNFYNRLREYAFSGKNSTTVLPAPPCKKQGNFQSIGRSPQSHPYLQVRRDK